MRDFHCKTTAGVLSIARTKVATTILRRAQITYKVCFDFSRTVKYTANESRVIKSANVQLQDIKHSQKNTHPFIRKQLGTQSLAVILTRKLRAASAN